MSLAVLPLKYFLEHLPGCSGQVDQPLTIITPTAQALCTNDAGTGLLWLHQELRISEKALILHSQVPFSGT